MPILNDTQRILLSNAAQHPDHSLCPFADSLARNTARTSKAIAQLLGSRYIEERETNLTEQVSRTDGDLRVGLFATTSGLRAIGVDPEQAGEASGPPPEVAAPAPTTKAAAVIARLKPEQGATLTDLITVTGWLPHTTRAALTGLRKKGHSLEKAKRDGATCYRIAG